jgi:hypothetical protein
MQDSGDFSQRARNERIYLFLAIGLPLLAMIAYFVFVFFLRDRMGTCPPACRDYDLTGRTMFQEDYQGADLRAANLGHTNLFRTNFANADLSFANLAGADLTRANLQGANLTGVALSGALLDRADLRGADLDGARLDSANLAGADLRGADIRAVMLAQANLRGAVIDATTRIDDHWRTVWTVVNEPLPGRVLAGADLRDANLIPGRTQPCGPARRRSARRPAHRRRPKRGATGRGEVAACRA